MTAQSSPRYWVIAPFQAADPKQFDEVWQSDLEHGVISIGWQYLGDISSHSKEQLKAALASQEKPGAVGLIANMLWNFYHEIKVRDIVIARRGRKTIAAVGTVERSAYYDPEKAGYDHRSFLDVRWRPTPRDKSFDRIVFGMVALHETSESRYAELVGTEDTAGVRDQVEFRLERYLEEFIVSNFAQIFQDKLELYMEEGVVGQQYETGEVGRIDILAQEPNNSFVIIELKKGYESDKVVGQTLRYMGWVKENLCSEGKPFQGWNVKGMIICQDADSKLQYALKAANADLQVKYYHVDFKLGDKPFSLSPA